MNKFPTFSRNKNGERDRERRQRKAPHRSSCLPVFDPPPELLKVGMVAWPLLTLVLRYTDVPLKMACNISMVRVQYLYFFAIIVCM